MRILFDATTLCGSDGGPGAGIEHYTFALLRALIEITSEDTIFVIVPVHGSRQILDAAIGTAKHVRIVRNFFSSVPFLGRHLILPIQAFLCRSDVFFSPFGQLPFGWMGKRTVMTVHDVSIFDHPEWFPDETVRSLATQWIVPRSLARATKIICVSHFTQQRLHERFPITKQKTIVIPEGVEMGHYREVEHTQHFPFEKDYLLCLGTVEPRKNFIHVFAAFDRFLSGHPEYATTLRLIVAGKFGWKTTECEEAARAINHRWKTEEPEGVIRFLGSVTEEEKWYLLSRAAGLLFVSYEEGFGLPILESMSVGTPVIASRAGALEEVAGDAAILVDPEDVEAISLSIAQCVLVPEGLQSIREDGYRRARQFSWNETARQTQRVFQSLISHS